MVEKAVSKIYIVNKNGAVVAVPKTMERAKMYCKDFPELRIEEKTVGWEKVK